MMAMPSTEEMETEEMSKSVFHGRAPEIVLLCKWASRRAVSIERLFQWCRTSSSTELMSGASPSTM